MNAALKHGLEQLQGEFESHQLEIVLVPCKVRVNEGGCIRVAVSKNARWYSQFCSRHPSSRKRGNTLFDTCIKRRNIARLLQRLVDGKPTRSKYAPEILKLAGRLAQAERRTA